MRNDFIRVLASTSFSASVHDRTESLKHFRPVRFDRDLTLRLVKMHYTAIVLRRAYGKHTGYKRCTKRHDRNVAGSMQ